MPIPGTYIDSQGSSILTGFTSFNINADPNTVFSTNNANSLSEPQWDTNGPVIASNYTSPFPNCAISSAYYLSNDTVTTSGNSDKYCFVVQPYNDDDSNYDSNTLWFNGMPIYYTSIIWQKSTPSTFLTPTKTNTMSISSFPNAPLEHLDLA